MCPPIEKAISTEATPHSENISNINTSLVLSLTRSQSITDNSHVTGDAFHETDPYFSNTGENKNDFRSIKLLNPVLITMISL